MGWLRSSAVCLRLRLPRRRITHAHARAGRPQGSEAQYGGRALTLSAWRCPSASCECATSCVNRAALMWCLPILLRGRTTRGTTPRHHTSLRPANQAHIKAIAHRRPRADHDRLPRVPRGVRRDAPDRFAQPAQSKIRKLLSSTDIKIGEFQRILGVNANSYLKFMNGKYKDQWNATLNGTYYSAAYFFFRESKLGKRALGKIRAHKQSALGKGAPKSPAAASAAASLLSPTTGVKGGKPALPSLADAVADDEY